MATTTNIQMDTNAGTQNSGENNKKRSMSLALPFSNKTVTMFVFAYLSIATMILIMTANAYQSTALLDFGPLSASASTRALAAEIPAVQIPAAPYIIGLAK